MIIYTWLENIRRYLYL